MMEVDTDVNENYEAYWQKNGAVGLTPQLPWIHKRVPLLDYGNEIDLILDYGNEIDLISLNFRKASDLGLPGKP